MYVTMTFAGLEILLDRGRRPIRSLRWLPVFVLTVILFNLPSTVQSQDYCPNGTYLANEHTKPSTSSPGTVNNDATTSVWTATTWSPECRNCSEAIGLEYCMLCVLHNGSVVCNNCTHGYELKHNNCTVPPTTTSPPSNQKTTIIIAVVVSVFGVLVLVGVIVGIVFGVRRGVFEKCHCPSTARSPTPPPMPAPDDLGVSFTKKNDEESGTGQRVDLRYTEEPGATQNRVESVHYDGYHGPRDDDSVYMNDLIRSIPATVQEEDEDTYANTEDQDDEVYVNDVPSPSNPRIADTSRNTKAAQVPSSSISPSNQRIADAPKNTKATQVPGSSKPPRPRPKPQTPAKPNSATKPKAPLVTSEDPRGSMYPPEVPEDVYTNQPEPEDEDDEDYVNSDANQLGIQRKR